MPLLSLPDATRAKSWPLKALSCALGIAAIVLVVDTGYKILNPETRQPSWTTESQTVDLELAGHAVRLPANMIRFTEQRRGGAQARLDIGLSWPDLRGYEPALAGVFETGKVTGPIIYASVEPNEDVDEEPHVSTSAPDIRLRLGVQPGPSGLSARSFAWDSAYSGQELVFESETIAYAGTQPFASRGKPQGAIGKAPGDIFAARCRVPTTAMPEATCIRRLDIGSGLTLTYRFDRSYLADWRRLDASVQARIKSFISAKK